MQPVNTDQMTFTDVRHLPIVKQHARQKRTVLSYEYVLKATIVEAPEIHFGRE